MSKTCLTPEMIEKTVAFHGHSCPGLALGIRAAELFLERFERAEDEEIAAVVETDMCGVDAIQVLTGCTFGKGNLIYLDHGKNAFTFFRRPGRQGIRIVMRPGVMEEEDEEVSRLREKMAAGRPEAHEKEILQAAVKRRIERIMGADLEELFRVGRAEGPVPRRAQILESLICEACGEPTMESRTRRLRGRTLCIPCFKEAEGEV